jgi:uncharacterized protein
MTVQEWINEKMQDTNIPADLVTVMRESGVTELRLLNSTAEIGLRFTDPIEILVEFEPRRTLLDLVGLEGDLEMLLGHRVNLNTKKSLLIRKLNDLIEQSVPLHA